MTEFIEGAPPKREGDKVNVWLEFGKDDIWLCMKHDRDQSDQRLIRVTRDRKGKIRLEMQTLAAFHLCQAFGIAQKEKPAIHEWGSAKSDWAINVEKDEALRRAEAALDIGMSNCGNDPDCVYAGPLELVRKALNESP